jgi:enterochelin esterase-like enzyme
MLIEADADPNFGTVRFDWVETDPQRPALDVLLRLITLADNAYRHEALLRRGYEVVYREYSGGHDYACWRGGLADGLIELLGDSR